MNQLNIDLENGFDLRTSHQGTIDLLTEEFEIEVGEEEELLYMDNCVPDEDGRCPRKRACAGDDLVWLKNAQERRQALENKDEKFKKRNDQIASDKAALEKLKGVEQSVLPEQHDDADMDQDLTDDTFKVCPREENSKVVLLSHSTLGQIFHLRNHNPKLISL